MSDAIRFDATRSILSIGDRRIVFHCHHYNLVLQRTIDEGLGARAADVQRRAAMESSRAMLAQALEGVAPAERLARAAQLFGALGFGHADVSALSGFGGRVRLSTSHYAVGYRAKFGAASRPVCHFAVGFWAAAVCVVQGHAPERVVGREPHCAACANGSCEIEIEVL